MGFSDTFIGLIKGLICNETSKAQFNGLFRDEIELDKGVRRGCPLAPLLFALSTQPLMSLLKLFANEGKLKGIPLGDQGEDPLLF